jgi:hypothetical protein
MSNWSAVRWTGVLGLASVVAELVGFIFLSFAGASSPGTFDDAGKVLAFMKNAHFVFTTALILWFIGFTVLALLPLYVWTLGASVVFVRQKGSAAIV